MLRTPYNRVVGASGVVLLLRLWRTSEAIGRDGAENDAPRDEAEKREDDEEKAYNRVVDGGVRLVRTSAELGRNGTEKDATRPDGEIDEEDKAITPRQPAVDVVTAAGGDLLVIIVHRSQHTTNATTEGVLVRLLLRTVETILLFSLVLGLSFVVVLSCLVLSIVHHIKSTYYLWCNQSCISRAVV